MWHEVAGSATLSITLTCPGIYAVLQWKLSNTDEILTVTFSIPYGKFAIIVYVLLSEIILYLFVFVEMISVCRFQLSRQLCSSWNI